MAETSETRKSKGFALEPLRKGPEFARKYADTTASQEELSISLLFRTSIRLQKIFDRCFVQFGMTSQEAAVLIRCVDAGEISARRLANAMSRDQGKITRFLDRLEAGSFLSRRSDPRDQRSLVIQATRRGRRVTPQLKSMFEEVRKQLFAGFLASDIDLLRSMLSRLYGHADFLYQHPADGDRRTDKTRAKSRTPVAPGEQK